MRLKQRVDALEGGTGFIGIGDLQDLMDDEGGLGDPLTWPPALRGRRVDPALLRSLAFMED